MNDEVKNEELIEAINTPDDQKTDRQKMAEEKHREKILAYQTKKIDEIHKKVALGTMQIVASMKKLPWCARVVIVYEILFKRENKNYNEVGEWTGDPAKEHLAPWCVRLADKLKFWKRK